MAVPVYEIIDYTGNRYLLTKAAMKRARQVNFVGDEELENHGGKIVSLALKQVLMDEVKYNLAGEEKPVEKES